MSEIKVKKLVCPCCNAPLHIKDQGYGEVTCEYCGAIVYLSREDTDESGMIRVFNEADGRPLATMYMPIGWDVIHRYINDSNPTTEYPYEVDIDLSNNGNSIIHIQTGQAFNVSGPVGTICRQNEFTVQSPFQPIENYIENMAYSFANPRKMKIISVEERQLPVENIDKKTEFEQNKKDVENEMARAMRMSANGVQLGIVGLYSDLACKIYHLEDENKEKKVIALYTGVKGSKVKMLGLEGLLGGVNSMVGMLGGLGLMNGNAMQNNQEPDVKIPNSDLYIGNLNYPGQAEVLSWKSETIFMLISNEEEFEDVYEKVFKKVCSTFSLDQNVVLEYQQLKSQMEQLAQNNINHEQAVQQQNLNMLGEASRRLSRAYQQSTEAMMRRSNQAYERQRDSYNSRMAAQDRMRDKQSEAIRGVNTFIKPDGKEVEVPVSADTAWINEKGEIVGGTKGFNPGFGWKKMERKY